MSRHICFRCACGQAEFAASSRFTHLAWDDAMGVLRSLGIRAPFVHLVDDAEVDGGELLRWWEDALARMEEHRGRLPVLHEIWLEKETPHGTFASTDAGYFRWRDRTWMASAVWDELYAVPLPPEEWERRREWQAYDPPSLEEIDPELAATLSIDESGDRVPLSADAFGRIFRGTPLTLEHGDLLAFLGTEPSELREVARHAADRRETVVLYTY